MEKPIPYISNDNFSQEGIFDYWNGKLSGHDHVKRTYSDVVRMWRQFHGCPGSGDQGLVTVAQGVNWESSTNALQDQGTIGKTQRHQNWAAICGFTLKIDNEIVGRTKHRDHTHERVCPRCLLSTRICHTWSQAKPNTDIN